MTPIEWQVWNFGVLLAFAFLGISIAIANVPGIFIFTLALIVLNDRRKKDEKPVIEKTGLQW